MASHLLSFVYCALESDATIFLCYQISLSAHTGHFGYIELPVPIYHPCHVSELRQLLSLICLKCLRMKKGKVILDQYNATLVCNLLCNELPDLFGTYLLYLDASL